MPAISSQRASVTVRHSIPGRLRLRVSPGAAAQRLGTSFEGMPGVNHVRVNPACAAVILVFDETRTDARRLILAARVGGMRTPRRKRDALADPSSKPTKLSRRFAHFLSLSGVMAFVFARKVVFGAALAETALSPLGIIALLAAVPVFKDALRHVQEKRFTLEGFLAGGCAAAALSGQAVTALEILWIHSGAETLNAWVSERSRKSISAILDLTAKNTFVLEGGVEVEVPVSAVKPGDIVVLHTGEKISVDGRVTFGEALIDDSPITGRALPSRVAVGGDVYAGSYVRQGVIRARVESAGDRTYLGRIMRQVEGSLENKAPIETAADKFARNMVRLGLFSTGLTLAVTGSLWRAFTVSLIMACPCATVLSAQTAVSAAIAAAARRGVLIKGGRYLEEVGKADVVCFDKTGTLTVSHPRITHIRPFSRLEGGEDEALLWACSAEAHNHHPLALAIRDMAQARGISPISHTVCEYTLGKGVRAEIGKDVVHLGSCSYFKDLGIETEEAVRETAPLAQRGLTLVYLARNGEMLAAMAFANEPRPEASSTISALLGSGVTRVCMITGDAEKTALDLSERLGVSDCRHSALPEQKGEIVRRLRDGGRKVIMVGDGINDALALAEADVGVAMGLGGADVAIEAADIALVGNDLSDIVYVRDLSRRTLRVARQNFWIATSTNLGGALAGALGVMSPVAAGMLHIAHTLGVLANSSRLLLPPRRLP